ncbi:hypothetical protein D0Z00_002328 [Geotrichum galactomycetum]|uniref:Uncharacterized protein n=1 Tax=Geotrichum galactomycetum TaxID=27317 RepID=A0ACB6V4D6_9ASCO|nr:hypothetical protein D0Z00_002328 [Geotrichum candidum]
MRFASLLLSLAAGSLALPIPAGSDGSSTSKIDFQVAAPLPDLGAPVAQVSLGEHTFENSWGQPYITTYTPPADLSATQVRIKLEVSSSGIQYDRLARLYIGGSEIWRTSTAEPTGGAMSYSHTKDVTKFLALFKSPQDVVFDLGNTVNEEITGAYWTRLTIEFYNTGKFQRDASNSDQGVFQSLKTMTAAPDSIIPIRPADKPSTEAYSYSLPDESIDFNLPPLPRNTTKVVLDISASGNGDDEFWYYHTSPETAKDFASLGLSMDDDYPSRAIQVLIDDELSGITQPFPVIFTGGLSPMLWIPAVGIKAFDLPTYSIDLTPVLPKLWNGANIKIIITTGFGPLTSHGWLVNANVLSWQQTGIEGSGTIIEGVQSHDSNEFSQPSDGSVIELFSVTKDISTQAILSFKNTITGKTEEAFIKSSQILSFTNTKYFYDQGYSRQLAQVSSGHNLVYVTKPGTDLSSYRDGKRDTDAKPQDFSLVFDDTDSDSNLEKVFESSYIYPMAINDFTNNGNTQLDVFRGYLSEDTEHGGLWTRQNASVFGSTGQSTQQYLAELPGNGAQPYERYVDIKQNNLVQDVTGVPNIGNSVSGFGKDDSITVLVSKAAVTAAQVKNTDPSQVVAAIKAVFATVLPPSQVGLTSKRSLWSRALESFGWSRQQGASSYQSMGRTPFGSGSSHEKRDNSQGSQKTPVGFGSGAVKVSAGFEAMGRSQFGRS